MVATSGNGWRLAKSLTAAAVEATKIAPNRSVASDGSIGDTSHQARPSDHNPDASGDVLALDLTHDPAHGFDAHAEAERIRKRRDPRVKYVISRGMMYASYDTPKRKAWQWGTYTGINGHFQHIHISVLDTSAAKNDISPWFAVAPPAPIVEDDMPATPAVVAINATTIFQAGRTENGRLQFKVGAVDGGANGTWVVFDGQNGLPNSAISSGPAAALVNGKIVIHAIGTSDDKMYQYRQVSAGTWLGAGAWIGPVGCGGIFG